MDCLRLLILVLCADDERLFLWHENTRSRLGHCRAMLHGGKKMHKNLKLIRPMQKVLMIASMNLGNSDGNVGSLLLCFLLRSSFSFEHDFFDALAIS